MSLDELLAAEAEVAACRRARARAEQLADEVAAEQRVCQVLSKRLRDERADVDALTGASIRSVLAKLRGHQDDLLERERAEVAEVELELATHRAAVQRLMPEFEAVRAESLRLDDAEARLEAALARRAEELAAHPATAEQMTRVEHRLAEERDAHDQFRDAHVAALAAVGAIDRALESMSAAKGLSNLDLFTDTRSVLHRRGDLISALKHDHLDASVERLAEVHASLLHLRPHLALVATEVRRPDLSMPSSRASTLDTWFDNVFSDFIVHRRISGSVDDLRRSKAEVEQMVAELASYEQVSRARLEAVEAERQALLRS